VPGRTVSACFITGGSGTGSGGGSGTSLPGEGQACGPRRFGLVTKSVGCRRGLYCQNGFCRRLAQ
jgi:hypothetical protein